MSTLPILQLPIFTQTESVILETTTQLQPQQQQQQQLLKNQHFASTSASNIYTRSSSMDHSTLDMLDLILNEFPEDSVQVPSLEKREKITSEHKFATHTFYESNVSLNDFVFTLDHVEEVEVSNKFEYMLSPSPSSPSPSPFSSSASSSSASSSSPLQFDGKKPSSRKKNRGTPPKPVNGSKEELEKYQVIRVRNNQSAQASRKKKKEKEEENISRLEQLKKENEELRVLLGQFKNEAISLHQELQKLIQNFKKD